EAIDADLLLHVIDASHPDRERQIAAVDAVLVEIGADEVPRIMVLNKCDLAQHAPGVERDEYGKIASVRLSALTGAGVPELRAAPPLTASGWRRLARGAGPSRLACQRFLHCRRRTPRRRNAFRSLYRDDVAGAALPPSVSDRGGRGHRLLASEDRRNRLPQQQSQEQDRQGITDADR